MLMIYKNSIVQFYSKNHKNIFFIVILQRFNIKEAGLKPCFFYVTLSPRRKCELPIPEVTRLRTMSCEKTEYNESEQSIADFIVYAIVCVIETEYEAEKWKISKIQKL